MNKKIKNKRIEFFLARNNRKILTHAFLVEINVKNLPIKKIEKKEKIAKLIEGRNTESILENKTENICKKF